MAKRETRGGTPLPPQVVEVVDEMLGRFGFLKAAREELEKSYRAIVKTYEAGGIFYLCGNGGSFADAIHIKGELAKSFMIRRSLSGGPVYEALKETAEGRDLIAKLEPGFPVVVLGESHSIRSAYENDRDPVYSYAQELLSFAGHGWPGVLMGISTSGNAKNVAAAMHLAKACGFTTIGFTGPGGGRLAEIADIAWRVPGKNTPEIQENQVVLYHSLCRMVEGHFFG